MDRHLMPSETDVVLAKLDVGRMTVRAVRARVSDELREILAAGGTEVGDEIIEVRVGDNPRGQPVIGERPTMISFEDSRALVFGLLPEGAAGAEAVSPDGERVPCILAPGLWLVVLPDNQRGAELIRSCFTTGLELRSIRAFRPAGSGRRSEQARFRVPPADRTNGT